MNMRAKFKINTITQREGSEVLEMSPVCKDGGYRSDGLDEDNTFAKFSPSGKLELTIANPALQGQFKPGETYYLDFTKVVDIQPGEAQPAAAATPAN